MIDNFEINSHTIEKKPLKLNILNKLKTTAKKEQDCSFEDKLDNSNNN